MKHEDSEHLKMLGLQPGANLQEIRSAYRKLAKKYHPDCSVETNSPSRTFHELHEAYEKLTNASLEKEEAATFKQQASREWVKSQWNDPFEDISSAISLLFLHRLFSDLRPPMPSLKSLFLTRNPPPEPCWTSSL